jgi:hypothetical protein
MIRWWLFKMQIIIKSSGEYEAMMASPIDGFVKINWNATVDKNKKKTSIDIIIRDNKGEVMTTLSEPTDHIIVHDIAKATTTLRASNFSRKLGFALQVVQALEKKKEKGSNWSRYGYLIEDT